MIAAVVRLLMGTGTPVPSVSPGACPPVPGPAAAPAHQHAVRLRPCPRHNPSLGGSWKRLFPNLASDPACWGLRREGFTSGPNAVALQKNRSGPQWPRALHLVSLRLPGSAPEPRTPTAGKGEPEPRNADISWLETLSRLSPRMVWPGVPGNGWSPAPREGG